MRAIYSGVDVDGRTYLLDLHGNTLAVDCIGLHFAVSRERMQWGDFDEIDDAVRFAFGGK